MFSIDSTSLMSTGVLVNDAAANMVAVLGQIGQVTEVGEGADHADRLLRRKRLEQGLERAVGLLVGVTAEGHRQLAYALDQLVGFDAFLLANHITQHAPEQADVFHQGFFVGAGATNRRVGWGRGRAGGHGDGILLVPLCA